MLLLLLIMAGAIFLFGLIAHQVLVEKEEELDHSVFSFLSLHVISPPLTAVMKAITFCASSLFLQLAYGVIIVIHLVKKNWKRAIEIAVIGSGGFLINYFMKLFFQRPRPSHPLTEPLQNFSFPSGHATSGFIFYGLLVYLLWKAKPTASYNYIIGSFLILFSMVIGFSRVYLRLHYASDVLAGFCIGYSWLLVCIWLMEYLKKKTDVEMKLSRS